MRGPSTPPPSFTNIDKNPFNSLFTQIFLHKLEVELGRKARSTGYPAVIETITALAARHRGNPTALREASERVLESLFPGWLPPAFERLFSKPAPQFAAWINAVVTVAVTQWLMGPSKLADDGATVEIERCRYLEGTLYSTENFVQAYIMSFILVVTNPVDFPPKCMTETGCVGVCVHSCKSATESFFQKNMGIGLAIEPNLDDFSCKFQFGKQPLPEADDPMFQESCFASCPMSSAQPPKVCNTIKPSRIT